MTPEDRPQPNEIPVAAPDLHHGRRRLIRGGLATAPALLTLVNRPVMAQACSTASAVGSANLSRAAARMSCNGLSASYWSKESSFAEWPSPMAAPGEAKTLAVAAPEPGAAASASAKKEAVASPSTLNDSAATAKGSKVPKATTFDSVFGTQGGYPNKSLVEVMAVNSNTGRDGLARHLAAAYVNILKGHIPSTVLDVQMVKNIWASVIARGYYEPTAGIRWFPDYAEPTNPQGGIIAWLKTTMPR
jgi:hypothetical protein